MPPRRRDSSGRLVSESEIGRERETTEEGSPLIENAGIGTGQPPIREPSTSQSDVVRVHRFQIEKLIKANVRNWKLQMEDYMDLQGCWEVVEYTKSHPERISEILAHKSWRTQNAKARIHIRDNIQEDDITATRHLKGSGEIWAYFMKRYEAKNETEELAALERVVLWRKDPSKSIEESLKELERWNTELKELSDNNNGVNNRVLMFYFLRGLPEEYKAVRSAIIGSGSEAFNRDVILSKLQTEERWMISSNGSPNEVSGESANWAFNENCYNCGEPGHRAAACKKPRKNEKKQIDGKGSPLGQNQSSRKPRGRDSRGRGRGFGNRPRGKARVADEDDSKDDKTIREDDGDSSDETAYFGEQLMEDENAFRIELNERISEEYETLITDERSDEALRGKSTENPVIDSGATSHCSSDIELFESLDRRYKGSLGTAGKSTTIAGKGVMRIPLGNETTVRLSNVLCVPAMTQTLLSTQMLHADGIFNEHVKTGYRFFRKRDEILATGFNIGRTSYLGWVKDIDALLTRNLDEEKEYARILNRSLDWNLLHRRLGHPGQDRFRMMANNMGLTIDDKHVDELHRYCETCLQSKSVKSQNRNSVPRATRPLRRVYMDFWGPYKRASTKEGWKYYLSLTDNYSRFSWIFLTTDRLAETVRRILEQWLAKVERETGELLLTIRTDNAREFKALIPWATTKGIDIEFIEPHTQAQNGVAERLNRFLLEVTRAILIDAKVPKQYWHWAIKMANYLRNRTIKVKGTNKTPFELWFGYPVDVSKFRVPFCKVWFHIEQSGKMEPRAMEGTFIGYLSSKNQYSVLGLKDRRVHRVTNPIFFEDQPGFLSKKTGETDFATEPIFQRAYGPPDVLSDTHTTRKDDVRIEGGSDEHLNEWEIRSLPIRPTPSRDKQQPDATTPLTTIPESRNTPIASEDSPQSTEHPRRSDRIRRPTQAAIESEETERVYGRKPRQVRRREEREAARSDSSPAERADERERRVIRDIARLSVAAEVLLGEVDDFANRTTSKFDGEVTIPKTYQEAVNDPTYGAKWRESIRLEINSLVKFGTWRYVRRPQDQSVVTCKWVFDVKRDADGRIDRFKARLVARGFSQREGLDFEDTFAPVVRLESLRILFALAATYGLTAHLLDATNAYVGSNIDKKIYMELPEGVTADEPGQICELLRSLYGLKQSAYLWQQKVKNFVTTERFRQSSADPGVFINDRGVIIAVYVDDILVFGKNSKDIETTKELLKKFHPMKDAGRVSKILGIRVTWMKDGSIRLDQEVYAESILEEFGMSDCRAKDIPIHPSLNLSDEATSKLKSELHREFQTMIGRLVYLAGGTRIDMQFVVNRLSQHLATPREIHYSAAKHLLRYLRKTTRYSITYWSGGSRESGAKGSDGKLVGYSDASFGNANKNRSTSGYVFIIAGGPVSWGSRKQPITATSTTEAEYIAAADAGKQAIWIRHFLFAIRKHHVYDRNPTTILMNPAKPTDLGIDNKGALALAANPVAHGRSKHIRIRYHAIRDFIEHGEINAVYVPTDKMLADTLTKAVKSSILHRFVEELRLEGK